MTAAPIEPKNLQWEVVGGGGMHAKKTVLRLLWGNDRQTWRRGRWLKFLGTVMRFLLSVSLIWYPCRETWIISALFPRSYVLSASDQVYSPWICSRGSKEKVCLYKKMIVTIFILTIMI